jgi:hypothetical protein
MKRWTIAIEEGFQRNTSERYFLKPERGGRRHRRKSVPKTSEMIQSKYLKTADVPDPVIVTVVKVGKVNLAKEDAAPEYKWAIRFKEFEKPMVLNSTNIKICEKILGSDNTDEWVGKEIVLFTDENVSFQGELVGGLRFKGKEKEPQRVMPKPTGGKFDDMADDIPF